MAGNRIDVNLSVNDQSGSLKKRNEEAKELNRSLSTAASTAEKAMKAAAKFKTTDPAIENREYNAGRALGGGTGASARDFAKEAQGLGGLVRLYATYAANLFAVTAAFNALRQAEATTMMVQGMDKLGAASGMALGGISKQLVMVTDGAISLREAMEATTKATASGLSRDQLLELGKVAKGASQALGINMSDALSRLSRGITKLEPELLDELGLFTKVGKATEDYAKSVNKSVDSLTDFERRQAFANAVLKEGRDKFGELAAAANPYDKLLASLSNVAQKVLELINTGLKPIVSLFAENSGLIVVALGLIAAKIFKQAIPAITSWRENLSRSAQASAKAAQELNTVFGENIVGRITQQFNVDQLDKDLKKANTTYDSAVKKFIASDNNYKNKSSILEALKSGQQLTARQLATLQADVNKRMNEGSEANIRHAKTAQAIIDAQKDRINLTKQVAQAEVALYGDMKKGGEEWQRASIARQRVAAAERMSLLSGVGEKVEKEGFKGGMSSFFKEVDSSKNLGAFDKLKTKGVGALIAISTAASIAMQAFGPLMWVVEAAIAVFMILDSVFSGNDKQVQAFNSSIDSLKESTKTATDVNEKYKNSLFNSQALIAYGNALTNVSTDITNLVKTLQDADKYATWWDRHIVDNIKVLWGGNLKAQFTKNIASGLEASVKAVPQGPLRTELENKLKGSLGTLDFQEAFAGMSNEDILKKGAEVSKIVSSVEQIVSKSKTLAQNVKETNKAAQEAFLNFSNAVFKPTQMQTFLASTTKEVVALKEAFQDSLAAPVEFQNILDKVTKLEYFSPAVAGQLSSIATQFNQINEPITKQRQEIERITKEIDRLKNIKGMDNYSKNRAEFLRLSAMLPGMEKTLNDMILKAQPKFKELGNLAAEQLGKEILTRVDYVLKETQLRLKQIDIQAKQATLAALPAETEQTIRERTRLQLEAINVENALRTSQQNLITAVDLLRVRMEITAAQEERKQIAGGRFATEEARQTALESFDTKTLNPLMAKAKAMGSGDVEGMRALLTQFPDLQSIIQARQSVIVSNAEANAKRADVILQGRLKQIDRQTEDAIAGINQQIKILEEEGRAFDPRKAGAAEAAKAREAQIADYNTMIRNLKSAALLQKTEAVDVLGAGVKPEVLQSVKAQLDLDKQRLETTSKLADKNRAQKLDIDAQVAAFEELMQKYNTAAATNAAAAENSFNARKQEIDYQKEQLSVAQQNGAINQDDFNQRTRSLALRDAELERDRAIYAQGQRNAEETLQWRLKVVQAGNVITENLQLEIDGIQERNVIALTGIANQYGATKALIDLNYENNTRQMSMAREIGNVFEGVTDKMTDAFVKFAETGKLSFKDLANSVIADIARIIIKMQIMAMMESMFGKGFASSGGNWLANAIGSAIGSSLGLGGGTFVESGGEGSLMVLRSELPRRAKGAAYKNTGIEMYAKGGMFTNKIVAEPTMFKFAKGVGMMGEAGPEAIMPLRRDGEGNLGVIAQPQQQGKVEVVVNNYSGEKAETRETVDSRGNRKIEVVVGEMVAGEMGRRNSPVQQAMTNNFMTRPMITRR